MVVGSRGTGVTGLDDVGGEGSEVVEDVGTEGRARLAFAAREAGLTLDGAAPHATVEHTTNHTNVERKNFPMSQTYLGTLQKSPGIGDRPGRSK